MRAVPRGGAQHHLRQLRIGRIRGVGQDVGGRVQRVPGLAGRRRRQLCPRRVVGDHGPWHRCCRRIGASGLWLQHARGRHHGVQLLRHRLRLRAGWHRHPRLMVRRLQECATRLHATRRAAAAAVRGPGQPRPGRADHRCDLPRHGPAAHSAGVHRPVRLARCRRRQQGELARRRRGDQVDGGLHVVPVERRHRHRQRGQRILGRGLPSQGNVANDRLLLPALPPTAAQD